ncbi:phage tail tip lysozyme, partial [Lactobacillus iners]
GDWLTKGSDTNKNAQQIFDFLTKKIGFSGAGAAGVLAVALRESGFNPKAQNTGGGVAGIFQWSGFSNSVNGSRITAEGSIKAGDTSTLTMENELKLVRHELNGGWAKVKSSVGKATDP